jgi:undecaprenyl-diphosphatase
MLEQLLSLDRELFIWINNGLSNPFLNFLCLNLRNQATWYPMYAIFIYFLIKQYKVESWKILLAAGLMVLLSDQFSANLVKNTFMRLRPCAEPLLEGKVNHLTGSCNGYSFISAHATNHFAVAIFLAYCFRSIKWLLPALLFWAFSIAFSQVYVGVHYPFDVTIGALCGVLFGLAFSRYVFKFVKVKE